MNLWMKIRVWTKIIFFGIIALYILLFLIFNVHNTAKLWLHPMEGGTTEWSVLSLAVGAFALGVIATLLTRTIFRTLAQLREMKRKRMEKEAAAIISRAAKLRVREQNPMSAKEDPAFPVVMPEEKA